MPSQDQHRRKAESNRKFLATISLDDYPDWVVVLPSIRRCISLSS